MKIMLSNNERLYSRSVFINPNNKRYALCCLNKGEEWNGKV